MEIKKLKIGKDIWYFINENWETSRSWGHRTIVFKNDYEYLEHKCRYINRTWEMYRYQSCMYCAVEDIKDRELNRFIDNYKYENNIERFKKGQKEELIKQFEKTEIAKVLKKLNKAIELNEWS